MENMDKSKMYISPSKESIMAYVDGEWKQFLRSDVIQELQVKTCNKPAVSKCEDVEREPAVCLHNYVYYGECDENIIHRCVKCGNLK